MRLNMQARAKYFLLDLSIWCKLINSLVTSMYLLKMAS